MTDSESTDSEAKAAGEAPTGVTWSAITDVGRFRKNNEDAFLALEVDAREVLRLGKLGEASLSDGDFIFAVSDGMGGRNAGEFASQIAVEKITQLLPNAFRLDVQGMKRGSPDLLEQVFYGCLSKSLHIFLLFLRLVANLLYFHRILESSLLLLTYLINSDQFIN